MNEMKDIGFEEAMERLEGISARLAGENVPLDEAISLYEQGVQYYSICKGMLEDATRRIEVIEKEVTGTQKASLSTDSDNEDENKPF